MDWHYLGLLLKGVFWNIRSIPAYVGLATLFLRLVPQWEGGKMNWIVQMLREHPALVCMSFLMLSVILVSHSLYVNKAATFATPDELTQAVLQNRDVRIADLVREDIVVRNKTFVNCHIYGPAVILPKNCIFDHFTVEGTRESAFIETPNTEVWGIIIFDSCTIRDCKFHKTGFIGDRRLIQQIKAGFTPLIGDSGSVPYGQRSGNLARAVTQNPTIKYYFANQSPAEKGKWHQYLTAKYPLGYAVFAADGTTIHVPNELSFERDLAIDWATARVLELTADHVRIQLPDVFTKETHNLIHWGTSVKRKVGSTERSQFYGIMMVVEALSDEGDFVVFAVGFQEANRSDQQPSSSGSQ